MIKMATATKIAGMQVIPRGFSVVNKGGTNFITPKARKKKRGLSKAQKQRIRTAAKKTRIPILTILANSPAIIGGASWIVDKNVGAQSIFPPEVKARTLWNSTMKFYTGLELKNQGGLSGPLQFSKFDFGALLLGWLPNIGLQVIKKMLVKPSMRKAASTGSGGLISLT